MTEDLVLLGLRILGRFLQELPGLLDRMRAAGLADPDQLDWRAVLPRAPQALEAEVRARRGSEPGREP